MRKNLGRLSSVAVWFGLVLVGGELAALTPEEIVILGHRAGLGLGVVERVEFELLSREAAVDRLLERAAVPDQAWPFSWRSEPLFPKKTDTKDAIKERQKLERERFAEWTRAWGQRLVGDPDGLGERLVLFWHNHFTTSFDVVKSPEALVRQDELIRSQVLGNFRTFLREITVDPAMMVYLNTKDNKKGKPNENYARELFELFTLGEGNYTETDVLEAARCLTGLLADPVTGAWSVSKKQHDEGNKTLFGVTQLGTWETLIDALLTQPAAAEFVPRKLWVEFVGVPPSAPTLVRLATVFRDGGWELKPLVRAILLSPDFWDSTTRYIRSPAELMAVAAREYQKTLAPDKVTNALRRLDQPLGQPVSVLGWPVGPAWINAAAVLDRKALEQDLFKTKVPEGWQYK